MVYGRYIELVNRANYVHLTWGSTWWDVASSLSPIIQYCGISKGQLDQLKYTQNM